MERISSDTHTTTILGFDPEVTPILGFGLGVTGIVLGLHPRFVPIPLALTAMAALFYRDPERTTPDNPIAVFAVSDGVVLHIDETYEHRFLHTDVIRISTMLSPFNVPVNRNPIAGTVRYHEHITGEYRPVSSSEASERNTRTYVGIETTWGPILISQIAGPLSRQIVSHVKVGDVLDAGERIGTVRFGSRTDLMVQRDSLQVITHVGEKLTAGITPIAHMVSF